MALILKLKISLVENERIYRVIEIGGNETFERLANTILDAFAFDRDHLYMFSTKRKPYDAGGIYHPLAEKEKSSDEIRLCDVGPKVRNKYLFLYDFGDEWMFYVTVMQVRETEHEIMPRVAEGRGVLDQYAPRFLEDEWEDDEDWSGKSEWDNEDEQVEICISRVEDARLAELLQEIPALMQSVWLRLVGERMEEIAELELCLFDGLEEAGLLEIEEHESGIRLNVKNGESGRKREIPSLGKLPERCRIDNLLLALIGIYGVIDWEKLRELFRERFCFSGCAEEMVFSEAEKMVKCGMLGSMLEKENKFWFSSFCLAVTEEILQKRKEYPVKAYRDFDDETLEILQLSDWREACPVYVETMHFLCWEKRLHPEDAAVFLDDLTMTVALGYTEKEYFGWIEELMRENGIALTKNMRKKLKKFRDEMPSAALKGYTWGEYERHRKDGYHQMSLFEDELPFS